MREEARVAAIIMVSDNYTHARALGNNNYIERRLRADCMMTTSSSSSSSVSGSLSKSVAVQKIQQSLSGNITTTNHNSKSGGGGKGRHFTAANTNRNTTTMNPKTFVTLRSTKNLAHLTPEQSERQETAELILKRALQYLDSTDISRCENLFIKPASAGEIATLIEWFQRIDLKEFADKTPKPINPYPSFVYCRRGIERRKEKDTCERKHV